MLDGSVLPPPSPHCCCHLGRIVAAQFEGQLEHPVFQASGPRPQSCSVKVAQWVYHGADGPMRSDADVVGHGHFEMCVDDSDFFLREATYARLDESTG